MTKRIHEYRDLLKQKLYEFIRKFDIDILVPENALTIPLNVPLGLAVTEIIAETGIKTIAHHHDFFWERKRFLNNCVWDYLNSCFPPHLSSIQHVVINSSAQNQLALRTGIGATLIPNVMDFEHPPEPPDEYTKDARKDLGIKEGELLVLQPTRVVQRKGIEHAIDLLRLLGDPSCKLIVSHDAGDEGFEYVNRVTELARDEGIDMRYFGGRIGDQRQLDDEGRKIYTLEDLYPAANLVTFPSMYEGFGNAFLEAVYHRVPIVVNRYPVFARDIERVRVIKQFIDEGYLNNLLIACDVCLKTLLHRYGGWGYDHIQTNLLPYMRKEGITDEQLHMVNVENPACFLDAER